MALEISVQVTLVGEIEILYKLLETLMGVHKHHLKLNYGILVNNLLCVLSRCTLAYGVQVAGRDLEVIGIVLHRAFLAELVCKHYSELIEQLVALLGYRAFACLFAFALYLLHIEQ